MALKADGTVVVWGLNANGQTNVPAGLKNVIAITAGQNFSIALIGSGPPLTQAPLNNPVLGSNGFTVNLPSLSGRVYSLEYKNSLSDTDWNLLPLIPGTGSAIFLTDPTATNSQRFYRVQRW
jgi:hypothetical protein